VNSFKQAGLRTCGALRREVMGLANAGPVGLERLVGLVLLRIGWPAGEWKGENRHAHFPDGDRVAA
jgi:hypothetical protein